MEINDEVRYEVQVRIVRTDQPYQDSAIAKETLVAWGGRAVALVHAHNGTDESMAHLLLGEMKDAMRTVAAEAVRRLLREAAANLQHASEAAVRVSTEDTGG